MPTARVLIISNRLPITATVSDGTVTFTQASGGLATGLRGCHERSAGLWIGWPGIEAPPSDADRSRLDEQLSERGIVPVYLSDSELREYYEDFSNGVLWPLFHYLLDRLPLGPTSWSTYQAVNQRFADLAIERYQPGDLVWVHDYQLMLVPAMIRRRLPQARIGFFLHIPFPAVEVFKILPWRRQLLSGLLGADLIGFHTLSYQQHFAAAAADLAATEPDEDGVWVDERRVQFGVFPMGIDAASFHELAASPRVDAAAAELKAQAGGRSIFLGIDRLDYTKGLPRRLAAFESLLQRNESLRDQVRLIQVAVPSREAVADYQLYRREVEETVGRINGLYGTLSSVPVHYLYQSVSPDELVALYRAADVMLVTPLRDGMNLVAKEFVASRVDGDGVLILSEFAGAVEELQEAITVNPYDADGITDAMQRGLSMAEGERRKRMRIMHRRVTDYDVHHWAEHFVRTLASGSSDRPATSDGTSTELLRRLKGAASLTIVLDYDGTLVPIARTPDEAVPDDELRPLIERLAARPHTAVLMVSGRARDTFDEWFGTLPIELWAEHGVWLKAPSTAGWTETVGAGTDQWLPAARALMQQFANTTPGAIVETKTSCAAWHYRQSARGFGRAKARELRMALSRALVDQPAEVLEGKYVVEVRPRGASKAAVIQQVLSRPSPPSLIIAFGDDRTDEELFAALPSTAIAVHVGFGASLATHRLPSPKAVRALLTGLLDEGNNDGTDNAGPS